MKTIILAGGLGTRLSEETHARPKPMVEIGGKPILWHIMKSYAAYGFDEFVLALGYKADFVKRYFMEYADLNGNMSVRFNNGYREVIRRDHDSWQLHLIDTGNDTQTGGRLKKLKSFVEDGTFMLTYGDGVCDVPIDQLVAFHKANGKLATLTAVRPPARFGGLLIDGDTVKKFSEKPQTGEGWINGGFLVLEPEVIDRISGNYASLESELLETLAKEGQLGAFTHDGFWQCMDTLRDVRFLEELWNNGNAPWKVWQE